MGCPCSFLVKGPAGLAEFLTRIVPASCAGLEAIALW